MSAEHAQACQVTGAFERTRVKGSITLTPHTSHILTHPSPPYAHIAFLENDASQPTRRQAKLLRPLNGRRVKAGRTSKAGCVDNRERLALGSAAIRYREQNKSTLASGQKRIITLRTQRWPAVSVEVCSGLSSLAEAQRLRRSD